MREKLSTLKKYLNAPGDFLNMACAKVTSVLADAGNKVLGLFKKQKSISTSDKCKVPSIIPGTDIRCPSCRRALAEAPSKIS